MRALLYSLSLVLLISTLQTVSAEEPALAAKPVVSQEADATEMPRLILAYDFYYYWAAGHGILDNRNIYDKQVYYQELLKAVRPKTWSISGWLYPPWGAWFTLPFALLPFAVARVLWVIFYTTVFALSAYAIRSKIALPAWAQAAGTPASFLMFILLFPPVFRFAHLGQAAFLLLASFLLYLYCEKRKMSFLSGLVLSVSLMKFHLLLPVYAALLVKLVKEKNFNVIWGGAVGFAAQCGVVLFFYPNAFADYFTAWNTHASETVALSTSPSKLVADAIHIPQFQFVPCMLASLFAMIWAMKNNISNQSIFLILHPIAIVCSPYTWIHTSLQLLLPYSIASGLLYERYKLAFLAPMSIAFVGFLYAYKLSQAEVIAPLIPIVVVALVWLSSKETLCGRCKEN